MKKNRVVIEESGKVSVVAESKQKAIGVTSRYLRTRYKDTEGDHDYIVTGKIIRNTPPFYEVEICKA